MPIARKMVDQVTIRTVADEGLRAMRFPRATYILHFKPLFPDACIAIEHESEQTTREKNERQSERTTMSRCITTEITTIRQQIIRICITDKTE